MTTATWINDDSDVIDAIESAKAEWFIAHASAALPPTNERTDEDINEALGLPRSGAIRSLAGEFADWTEAEVQDAVKRGLNAWLARAEVRYETLTDYSAAPAADKFHVANLAELESISAQIDAAESSSLQTDWSKSAWQTDREACTRALALAHDGRTILVSQDEDGYYFATERR